MPAATVGRDADRLQRYLVRKLTAIHGAGHYVAAKVCNVKVEEVRVNFGAGAGRQAGCVRFVPGSCFNLLLISLAGPVAEALFTDEAAWETDEVVLPRNAENERDFLLAEDAALVIAEPRVPDAVEHQLERERLFLLQAMRQRWHDVDAVATALMKRRRLGDRQASAILREARKRARAEVLR